MAENVCVVHQQWSWVRRGGFVPLSTSRHLWALCKANEFAVGQGKDTPYQGKAAFAHLGLNSIILLETVKEQSQSPPPGMQLRCSMSSSPAAASRHAAPQSAWYQLSSAIVQPSKAQSCPCANTLLSKKRICTRPQPTSEYF